MDALPITVLLLARDEAPRLARLLPRLAFARDVLVVVDAATRDSTREVAAAAGARVLERALDGFGPQRRFGLAAAREPWVLWIDADEWPDDLMLAALPAALARTDVAGFRVRRGTWFLGARIRWCGWQGEWIARLFRRDAARFDDAPVHEQVTVSGALARLPGLLEHHSYESWEECRDKLVRYAAAGAEKARRAGRGAGPLDLLLRPPLRFLRMYVLQLGVLDGARGVAVCALASAQVFLKYAELWARPRGARRGPGAPGSGA